MPKLIERYTYGFEDVSLEPHHNSPVFSRKTDVDTTVIMGNIKLHTPIIASPMKDVCDHNVAIAIAKAGGVGAIHRFQTIEQQVDMVSRVVKSDHPVLAAVGTTEHCVERAIKCFNAGAFGIIIDVAFLNQRTIKICRAIRKELPKAYLISGNVATGAGFRMGIEAGLDAIRVGIGNGQACRTSRVTGVGIGLFTSLLEAYEESCQSGVKVICDGGMDIGGSFCKALAAGAHYTIMGRAFAGTYEGPGRTMADTGSFSGGTLCEYESMALAEPKQVEELIKRGSPIYKEYRGSASMESQMAYKARGEIVTSEGVASLVKVFGSVADVLGR